jgi:hypothetical protein
VATDFKFFLQRQPNTKDVTAMLFKSNLHVVQELGIGAVFNDPEKVPVRNSSSLP